MECIRGSAPLGLCVVLWICVWYVPTSAREDKAMNLIHNDIDGNFDHVFDHDDTNFNTLRKKAHIFPLKLKPQKKPGKGKRRERKPKSQKTTTTTEAATTTTEALTTTTEAPTTTTEAPTTTPVTISTVPDANLTAAPTLEESTKGFYGDGTSTPTAATNATSSTSLSTVLKGEVIETTETLTTEAGTTEIERTNATTGTTEGPGKETSSTAVTTVTVSKTRVPKSISYSVFVKKVTVHVIYESLCPFSRKFIVSQLLPAYQQLRDHMHLVLLPFGNARVSKTQTVNPNFICPRGSPECRSNMIETCVIRSVRETLTAVHIIACMSRSSAPHRVARLCVEKKGLEWHLVERCVTTSGKLYMLEMAKKTWQIKGSVGHVPLVVIEGEKTYTKEAQKDLIGAVCRRIPIIGICARRRK